MVMGGYGSGKSHLLLMLAELGEPDTVLAGRAWWPEIQGSRRPLVVTVSLVEHASARSLEEILLEGVARRLDRTPFVAADRRPRWQAAHAAIREAGYGGLLLLVDELSAYLRARTPVSALREDVRLLQYLGEEREFPLTLVATLQESLERATEADPEAVRRLRDRYVTLPLTGAHLESVVTERLLRPLPGHDEATAKVESRLRRALGRLPWDRQRLMRLYPVHPATLEHLESLRHYLSATRGALDFLYRTLKGDPEHGIGALLDEPLGVWLTPDRLFPHFAARLAEAPETAPLVERVGSLYGTEGERLFGTEAPLARRIADLLCVEAAGMRPRARTAEEIAQALALEEFGLDPGLAQVAVESLLERMTDQGAYVVRVENELASRDAAGSEGADEEDVGDIAGRPRRLAVRYRIDPDADQALAVRRRLGSAMARAREGESVEDRIGLVRGALRETGESLSVPVARLIRERESTIRVRWQQTERTGILWCGDLRELTGADVRAWARESARVGHDFTLAVALPSDREGHLLARQHLETELLATLAEAETERGTGKDVWGGDPGGARGQGKGKSRETGRETGRGTERGEKRPGNRETGDVAPGSVAFWVPASWEDLDLAREVRALADIRREFQGTDSEVALSALAAADALLGERLPALGRSMVERYFAGEWILGSGESLGRLEGLSLMGFHEVLATLVKSVLEARHPAHAGIMPRLVPSSFPQQIWSRIVEGLFREGEAAFTGDPEAAQAVEAVLVPLGLAAKHGHGYQVRLDPQRSGPLSALFGSVTAPDALEGLPASDPHDSGRNRTSLAEVEVRLMKGPLGLDPVSSRLTILAAVLGGLVLAYANGRRVPLSRLRDLGSLDAVDALSLAGPQDTHSVPEALKNLPFLTAQAEGAYLPSRQRELWARAAKWKAEHQRRQGDETALMELAHHPIFREWDLTEALGDLAVQSRLLSQVTVSLPPLEGLSRLSEASEAEGLEVGERLRRAEAWSEFLTRTAERLIAQERYLRSQAFDRLAEVSPELAAEREKLLLTLTALPGLLSQEAQAGWLSRVDAFQDAYAHLYGEAHSRAVGSDPSAALERLERLHGAPWLEEDLTLRDQILTSYCRLKPGRALAVEPACPCGYRIGDPSLAARLSVYGERLAGHRTERAPLQVTTVPEPGAPEGAGLSDPAVSGPGRPVEPGPGLASAAATGKAPGEPFGQDQGRDPMRRATVRRLSDLATALGSRGGAPVQAAELRRRFEVWLLAREDEEIEIRP